jgi:large subunit ribosomal protein L9
MKVILKEYVYKHGVAGDVVNVSDGFARNYLIPRGLAVKATKYALDQNTSLMAEAAMRRNELNDRLIAVSRQIDGVELVFGRKAGSNGKLYGSVTTMDIAQALLEKTGVDINRRRISERPLREVGSYDVPVRMGHELSPTLRVTIVREEDLAAYLSGGVEAVVAEVVPEPTEATDELDEAAALAEIMSSAESQAQIAYDDDDD